MFGHFTYLFYTLIFAFPPALFLGMYYWPILKKEWKVIGWVTLGIFIYVSVLWVYALTTIHVWWYSLEKILTIRMGGWVMEDSIWWIIILLLEVCVTLIFIKKEDTKEPLLKRD